MEYVKNYQVNELDEQRKVERDSLFLECANIDGKLYSFTIFKKIPITIDKNSGEINCLENLKDYDQTFITYKMMSIKNSIFALELNGKRIMKYDINKKICQYFNINCNDREWENYAGCATYEKYLYIFPRYQNKIVKINIESGSIQIVSKIYSDINFYKKYQYSKKELEYFSCGCQRENIMWLFQRQGNIIGLYNLKYNTYQEYRISITINDCVHAMWHKDILYLLSSEGRIYCWNQIDGTIERIADCACSNSDMPINTFSRIVVTDESIVLLPSLGKDIFYVNLETKKIEKYLSYPIEFRYYEVEGWSKYYGLCEDENYYYFAMRSTNYILTVDKQSGTIQWIKPIFPSYKKYKEVYKNYSNNLFSELNCSIEDMFFLLNNNSIENKKKNSIYIGYKIWKKIKI